MKITRKPHKVMSVEELRQKAETLAGIKKTPEQTLKDVAKKLQITHN